MNCRLLALGAALIAVTAISGSARGLIEIRLQGRYFSEPATVQMIIAVEPDQANRVLRIEADGDHMFRATEVTLEGASEKRLHNIEFKNLAAGSYELRAELFSSNEMRAVAREDLMVMGK
jgi:hypothetical protein